jgi:hypothetical protein
LPSRPILHTSPPSTSTTGRAVLRLRSQSFKRAPFQCANLLETNLTCQHLTARTSPTPGVNGHAEYAMVSAAGLKAPSCALVDAALLDAGVRHQNDHAMCHTSRLGSRWATAERTRKGFSRYIRYEANRPTYLSYTSGCLTR